MIKKKNLVAIIMLCLFVVSLTACQTEKSQIKETLTKFQESCRSGDMDTMLNCLDPDLPAVKLIESGSTLTTLLTGEQLSVNDIVQEVMGSSLDMQEVFDDLSIKNPKCKVEGETAVVTCTLSYKYEGEDCEETVVIEMTKKNDTWYIAGFDFEDE